MQLSPGFIGTSLETPALISKQINGLPLTKITLYFTFNPTEINYYQITWQIYAARTRPQQIKQI